jgi:hypothetical protein
MSHRNYIEEAEVVTDRFHSALADIANDRLGLATFQMEGKLKGPLTVLFGNGGECITYRGCLVQFWMENNGAHRTWSLEWAPYGTMRIPDDCWDVTGEVLSSPTELKPLGEALDDIMEILDNYSHGAPNDIKVKQ